MKRDILSLLAVLLLGGVFGWCLRDIRDVSNRPEDCAGWCASVQIDGGGK